MRDLKKLVDFEGLQIELASPDDIKDWSFGEVTKPETINYRTLKPEKDGLFSESIFGPTKDYECYCGKYKRIRYRGIVCEKCGVEVTKAKVRRERMGHIGLAYPVVHLWYFRKSPSKLSLLLNVSPKNLEAIVYFAQYLVYQVDEEKQKEVLKKIEADLQKKKKTLKVDFEKRIALSDKEYNKQLKDLEKKIKSQEQRLLAKREIELKHKQEVQALRDELVLTKDKAEEIYHAISSKVKGIKYLSILTEDEFLKLEEYHATTFFKAGMGAEVVLEVIKKVDLEKLVVELRQELKESKGARHVKAGKRLRVAEGFLKSGLNPAWMVVKTLPVLPPDLRPMVQLSGGRFASSDLNDLYRRVINRNNRLKHLVELGAPEIILRNEKRMLQEAVDSLIDSSKQRTRRRFRATKPLRSLSDLLKGKQGRFRQNLLGKRVDYSGRSVIVVGPELKLDQCGLPKEVALEMFKPFVLRELIMSGIAPNVKTAKLLLERRPPEVFDVLEKIIRDHPVLLNRAPTLHKLGIQAFFPILIEGSAIQIHPCICSGFNADFDGDQMAVHIPLGKKACAEAAQLMTPKTNLLKPANGSPITIPNKEIALGVYYLTSINTDEPVCSTVFGDEEEAVLAFKLGRIGLRQRINIRLNGEVMETTLGRLYFNKILPSELGYKNEEYRQKAIRNLVTEVFENCSREKLIKLIDDIKELGFWAATVSGLSVGVWDCKMTPKKTDVVAEANQQVSSIQDNFNRGLITDQERKRLSQDVWMETTQTLSDLTWEEFAPENAVRLIINSGGTRASRDQVKQLSAMRGLVLDPLGNIVEMPTKSNFREGLSVFEYVTSARGSRKGLTDSAIKTSDAGYLTRRLVDVTHDVISINGDCGTKEGIEIFRNDRSESFQMRLIGRYLAADIKVGSKTLLKSGTLVTDKEFAEIEKNEKIESVIVRSPLTCNERHGVCSTCYGWDLSTREVVAEGTPIGVMAAQSIGEPGTQLTMRTKHFGGIVVSDVTQGLPRVEELFELRKPKMLSPLAEIAGKVSVIEKDDDVMVRVRSVGKKPVDEREYSIPPLATLKVKDGQLVEAGAQLSSGSLDVHEVMEIKGLKNAQQYLVNGIQAVYESQGIPINDRHFEVVVRKMSDKVSIESVGDTSFLPGEVCSKARFEEENEQVLAQGGEPATARITLLGVSRSALKTDSWLSAASFEETINVLADAACEGKKDDLVGLKENVIIGRLIPVVANVDYGPEPEEGASPAPAGKAE